MISRAEITKGEAIPAGYEANLEKLLIKINIIRHLWGKPMIVNSGYRTPAHNKKVKGAANSLHMQCAAIDISDDTGGFWQWLMDNLALCEQLGFWLEDRTKTPTWVHLQIYPPASGNRIFMP